MKKALFYSVGLLFLLSTFAFAVDKPVLPVENDLAKTNIIKKAKMHATGKVIDISNEQIKIERTVKGDIETMEFALEKSSSHITIGDSVKIEYTEKDGTLTASKVSKVVFKNRKSNPAEIKSVPVK